MAGDETRSRGQFIVLDIGGTQIRAALCTPAGEIHARIAAPTPQGGADSVLTQLEHCIRQVWPAAEGGVVRAIGIGAPGPLDPWTGIIHRCPNIPGWDNYPLREVIARRFGVPVALGDDANVAALAEQRMGAGRGHPNLIYLTISTGVGSGIIVNNQLLLGMYGLAAEAGCMVVDPNGPLCACGNPGCLEALVSGPAIARRARDRIQRGEASAIADFAGGPGSEITARVLGEAAQAGDRLALSVLAEAGTYLGLGLTSLLHIFNPSIVVIGGSVSKVWDLLIGPAREVIRRRCLSDLYWRDTPIVPAQLGDDVGLLGALCLVREIVAQ